MMGSDVGSQNAVWRFFANPFVGAIGSTASVVGLGLAVLFYFHGIREPRLTYYVHPVKSTIAAPSENSRLKVFYDDELLKQAVTVAQVAFWNAGKLPIRRQHILRPLVISFEDAAILEVRLRKLSRDIVQIEMDESLSREGVVAITWNILEYGDGGIFEILFLGTPATIISAQAIIEGQPDPQRLEFPHLIRSPAEQYAEIERRSRALALTNGGFGAVLWIVMAWAIIRLRRRRERVPRSMHATLIILGTLILGMLAYTVLFQGLPGPPFGFG